MFERILFKSSVEFVGDYVLFAALSAFIRREQLKQVGAATGQNHPMGRNLPLAHLIDEQQPTKGKNKRKKEEEMHKPIDSKKAAICWASHHHRALFGAWQRHR